MRLFVLLLAAILLAGCTSTDDEPRSKEPVERATMVPDARKLAAAVPENELHAAAPQAESSLADLSKDTVTLRAEVRQARGIDLSHHQGPVDWERVAADGIEFVWLKATEGATYTDPTYADHRRRAAEAGLQVGGYHYFSICGDGAAQAEHFVQVVGDQSDATTWLAPALDVELDPACEPTRAELLARLRDFLRVAEAGTGRKLVVYAFPDLERRYRIATALDRPQWVRRLGSREPHGNWLVWQKSQTARVDGIQRPVDLNLMRR